MAFCQEERRSRVNGGVVCDNGVLRQRVLRDGDSLGLVFDACRADGHWEPLLATPVGADLHSIDATGSYDTVVYRVCEPVVRHGRTCGVALRGRLGQADVTFTSMLAPLGAWCQQRIEITGLAPGAYQRLTHMWLLEGASPTDLAWPGEAPARGAALAGHPAALLASGPRFAALVPDLEEGDVRTLGLRASAHEGPSLEYGVMADDGGVHALPGTLRLAYALYLDAHALPDRGFQQVVRMLGKQEALRLAACEALDGSARMLSPLPEAPDYAAWRPFLCEGSPAEIAAVVHACFATADSDWQALDTGLCWLDRLLLHQNVYELPAFPALGALCAPGAGAAAPWLPELLWHAFRLTGIREYAHRGIAALAVLPEPARSAAYAALHARFGDVYIQADCQEAVALAGITIIDADFSGDTITLTLAPDGPRTALRLVLDGAEDAYHLVINGAPLETVPTSHLRLGVELPLPTPCTCA